MATKAEIIAKAKAAILDFDEEAAEEVANEALKAGVNPAELIQDGFTLQLTEVATSSKQVFYSCLTSSQHRSKTPV
jgi:methanogenic corrinoid protein MtbC1